MFRTCIHEQDVQQMVLILWPLVDLSQSHQHDKCSLSNAEAKPRLSEHSNPVQHLHRKARDLSLKVFMRLFFIATLILVQGEGFACHILF